MIRFNKMSVAGRLFRCMLFWNELPKNKMEFHFRWIYFFLLMPLMLPFYMWTLPKTSDVLYMAEPNTTDKTKGDLTVFLLSICSFIVAAFMLIIRFKHSDINDSFYFPIKYVFIPYVVAVCLVFLAFIFVQVPKIFDRLSSKTSDVVWDGDDKIEIK